MLEMCLKENGVMGKKLGKWLRTRKALTHGIVERGEDSDPIILGLHRETSLLNFFEM